jgi:hypothetical protein
MVDGAGGSTACHPSPTPARARGGRHQSSGNAQQLAERHDYSNSPHSDPPPPRHRTAARCRAYRPAARTGRGGDGRHRLPYRLLGAASITRYLSWWQFEQRFNIALPCRTVRPHNDMLSVPSRRECRAARQQTSAGGDVRYLVTAPHPDQHGKVGPRVTRTGGRTGTFLICATAHTCGPSG